MKNKNDNFFQKKEVKDVLLKRGQNKENSICISGDGNGQYSKEYLSWNLKAMVARVTNRYTDDERKECFEKNPAPENKYK